MDKALLQSFADLNEEAALQRVSRLLEEGTDPETILNTCQEAMTLVGDKFEAGSYFISDLMLSGKMFKEVNELLKPHFSGESKKEPIGKVVIGTVAGDIHDIGKDLVVGLLEANNFQVYDLGVDQSKEVFIDKIKETGAKVVGLSGLLTIAFDAMKETVDALEAEGLRDQVKVMIGGGPVNQGVCDYVGADEWANSAQKAVKFCKECFKS
jgi:5-methyltetrahydrofolate--homocysteine methyltransferase